MNKLVKELKKAEEQIKQGKCKTVSAEDFMKKFRNRVLKHKYNYKIKGWNFDWELLDFYYVKIGKDLYSSDNETVTFMARKLMDDLTSADNKKNQKILAWFIRTWLRKALKFKDDYYHVWKGMLKIKYDGNLFQMTYKVMEQMWT